MINNVEDLKTINKTDSKTIPLRLDYVEKREIDRSTLYSIGGPFQLVHADVANLKPLGKSVTHPKYCLLIVEVFSSKIYAYPMRSRRLLTKKRQKNYTEVSKKRSNQKMRLQVDQEFQQNEIKQMNKKCLVDMFLTRVHGGKAFAVEQKIRELKKRISKLDLKKNKSKQITPTKLIKKLTDNMNKAENAKYSYTPDYIEKQSFSSKRFRISFNFDCVKKSKQVSDRLDK